MLKLRVAQAAAAAVRWPPVRLTPPSTMVAVELRQYDLTSNQAMAGILVTSRLLPGHPRL